MHGPTPEERILMEDWVEDLGAFVAGIEGYECGTKEIDEVKVMTPERRIEVQRDERWRELVKLAEVFAGLIMCDIYGIRISPRTYHHLDVVTLHASHKLASRRNRRCSLVYGKK